MDEYGELIGDTPELVQQGMPDLASLGGPGAELSTGLILTWRDKLVFGLESRAIPLGAVGQPDVAAFVGIGGHLDPGERWADAAVREALEIRPPQPLANGTIPPLIVTVAQQIERIEAEMALSGTLSFAAFLRQATSRLEIVVSLLAVLELVKRGLAMLRQDVPFGDILVSAPARESA